MNIQSIHRHLPIPAGAIALMALMAATRFHHVGTGNMLPDASLAVFFLSGLWFGGVGLFTTLLLEAGIIDYLAISQFNVSDYCISSAYVFLAPTYAVMWQAGRYCSKFSQASLKSLLQQTGILFAAISLAFVISDLSFYLFSGRYAEWTWAQYGDLIVRFYPGYLMSAFVYVVMILGIKALWQLLPNQILSKEA